MIARAGLVRAQDGAAAVEFALVVPVFLMFLMGGFYGAFVSFTASSMHYAVEAGARCAAVSKGVCSSTATTTAFVRKKIVSIGPDPSITVQDAACGKLVSSSVNFPIDLGIYRMTFPLSAQACHS